MHALEFFKSKSMQMLEWHLTYKFHLEDNKKHENMDRPKSYNI